MVSCLPTTEREITTLQSPTLQVNQFFSHYKPGCIESRKGGGKNGIKQMCQATKTSLKTY